MRFRAGIALGFAAGYYLGAKAGRERYEELRRGAERVRATRPLTKLQALVELAVERVRTHGDDAVQLVLLEEHRVAT